MLEHAQTSRRDFRSYALLTLGLVFVWAAATVSPASNCDESGRGCAPWLVPLAGLLGLLACAGGVALLLRNHRWGSRVDQRTGQLQWWDTRQSSTSHHVALDDIVRIELRTNTDSSDALFFYDAHGARLPIPKDDVFPHPSEPWARALVARCPHIVLAVDPR